MTALIIFDILGVVGLVMLGYGLYTVAPCLMFIIIGIIFVAFALSGSRRIKPPKKQG